MKPSIATLGLAITTAFNFSGYSPDVTYAQSTCPPTFEKRIKTSGPIDAVIFSYELAKNTLARQWLKDHQQATALLCRLPSIIHDVYGKNATTDLIFVTDPDTSETIAEVFLYTDVPIGQEFDEKEELLFKAIENAKLSAGLQHVVLSQR